MHKSRKTTKWLSGLLTASLFSLALPSLSSDLDYEGRASFLVEALKERSGQKAAIEAYQKQAESQSGIVEGKVYMAISLSMPQVELKSALEFMAKNNVTGVLRGVHPDAPYIDETGRLLHQRVKGIKNTPDVVINSVIFDEADIQKVPVLFSKQDGKVYRAPGSIEIEGFLKSIQDKKDVDLTVTYSMVEPVEIHFEQYMRDKLKAVDWESKKDGAIARYWKNMEMFNLPATLEDREFLVDLSIVLTQDIIEPSTGKVLKKKGEIVNPTKIKPFGRALVVFDPFSETQLQTAKIEVEKAKSSGLVPVVLLTRVDRKEPSKTMQRVLDELDTTPYILDAQIKKRFKLEKVPSIVTQEGDLMLVREIASNG